MSDTLQAVLHAAAYTGLALILLTWIGNVACRILFDLAGLGVEAGLEEDAENAPGADPLHLPSETEPNPSDADSPPAGWIIGWLERLVLALGIVLQSWQVVAAVIALKSVARFKELDKQGFAEYFLVGSLFSLLWAVLVTSLWMAYDGMYGLDLRSLLMRMIAP